MKRSSQLIPAYLHFFQNVQMSSDTILNLKLWVIIIISCTLFLCHDEFVRWEFCVFAMQQQ